MKIVNWLFLVSVLLFVCGVGFVIAAARTSRTAPPAATAAPPETVPVASIKQIMIGITNPSAYVIYQAVGTSNTAKGLVETAPQNDEEWAKVESAAAAVAESGNLLLTGNRAIDNGDWVKMTHDMIDKAKLAMAAARAHNKDQIVETGGNLNMTCDTCHDKYQRE